MNQNEVRIDAIKFNDWTAATAKLSWGAQRVLLETLKSVADGQVTLTHGRDYTEGTPCLINAAATMLSAANGEGGTGIPSKHFGSVVRAFDRLNALMEERTVNTVPNIVSPLAAEFLIHNFGPIKPEPTPQSLQEAKAKQSAEMDALHSTPECSDDELMVDWLTTGIDTHDQLTDESVSNDRGSWSRS